MDENISYLLWVLGVAREDTRHQTRWITNLRINPLLNPPGGLFISNPFEEGLNRDGGLICEGDLFN